MLEVIARKSSEATALTELRLVVCHTTSVP